MFCSWQGYFTRRNDLYEKRIGGEGRESNPTSVYIEVAKRNKFNNFHDVVFLVLTAFWATVAHFSKIPLMAMPSRLVKFGIHFR